MDDEAAYLADKSTIVLIKQVRLLLDIVAQTFAEFGFTINWAEGKTEIMLRLRGARADKAKGRLCNLLGGAPVILIDESTAVHVVEVYKHVGGQVESDGGMRQEVISRIKSATAAWTKLRDTLSCRKIPIPVRLRLVQSLVCSRLFFQAGTWSTMSEWCWEN